MRGARIPPLPRTRKYDGGVPRTEVPQETVEAFARLGRSSPIDVFEGALLVSRLIDAHADVEKARERVAGLARRVAARRAAGTAPLEALREILFEEEGFAGDSESYDEPPNCSVVHALTVGRGMPITLSILVQEVGRRSGVELEGVGLPGHFVLGGDGLPDGFYLDPFHGGVVCDAEELGRRVSEIFGAEIALSPDAFAPDRPVSILRRVLSNLRRSFERRHRYEEALGVVDCAEALDPSDPSVMRERGLLLLKAGEPLQALEALEEYRRAASGEDADAVAKLIATVRAEEENPESSAGSRRIFTLGEARALLPRVRERTSEAVNRYASLGEGNEASEEERQTILSEWAKEMTDLGVEIKGLWLVDFDSGAGYYCWKYPEPSLDYFHGYEEGFAGRLPLQ
jgi:regulator of sirC expression with transglutaminase-like and TPR domain